MVLRLQSRSTTRVEQPSIAPPYIADIRNDSGTTKPFGRFVVPPRTIHLFLFSMPALNLQPNKLYHIYNRGNNRETVFYTSENYRYFLTKLRHHLTPHLHILAWCLMPNHFHLLVQVREEADLQRCSTDFRILLSSYSRGIQKQQGRTGSLFQQHTRSKELTTEQYMLTCFCYIHQNPLRAGLARELGQWTWSSYADYTGLRKGTLCDQAAATELLDLPGCGAAVKSLIMQTLPDDVAEVMF